MLNWAIRPLLVYGGFGSTTILLNLHNAGFFALDSMILAMGVFLGGFLQIFAGLMEWKRGNTFALLAFCSYGLFWLSLVALALLPRTGLFVAATPVSMAAYLIVWGVFTATMFLGTLKGDFAHKFVFGSLAILFFLLAAGDISGAALVKTIAGYEGIICGAFAVYTGLALVLKEKAGMKFLFVK